VSFELAKSMDLYQ